MMPLSEQQLRFKQAVIASDGATDLFRARHDGSAPLLRIYQHAYIARLTEVLRDNYPVLHRTIGDALFDTIAQHYIARHPSTHPSVRWFGHQLQTFLQGQPDLLPHPALLDLVKMEWAICTRFDAADAPALRAGDLLALPPEAWPELRCQPHPSVALLTLEWEVEPAWRALAETTDTEQEIAAPEPSPRPHALLVWRDGLEPRWRSLDPLEAALLHACIAGQPFSALCEQAAQTFEADDAATTIVSLLRRWVDDGLFQSLRPAASS